MGSNKKIFWWNLLFFIISIVGVIVFGYLSKKFEACISYSIFLNIFISLVGGALIGLVTGLISFCNIKKQYEIKFYSEVKNIKNILADYTNWFNWNYDNIIYKVCDAENKVNKDDRKIVFDNSDTYVRDFITIIEKFTNYDFNEIYYLIDDYCSLRLFRRDNKIRKQMGKIMRYINGINILYDKNMGITYQLYKQGKYPENVVYNNIISKIKEKYPDSNEVMIKLKGLLKDYMSYTKVDEYTKKIAVKEENLWNLDSRHSHTNRKL